MTDDDFCKIETSYTGEPINAVDQLVFVKFTGRELKEYLEHAIRTLDNQPKPGKAWSWRSLVK
jgi:hypothetical protein